MSSWVRADSAVCTACLTRQSNSVASSRPITWPAFTASPSRTVSATSSAATFALTTALFAALSPPEIASVRISACVRTVNTSALPSSSAAGALAGAAAAAAPCLRSATARATKPASTATASNAMAHFIQRFIANNFIGWLGDRGVPARWRDRRYSLQAPGAGSRPECQKATTSRYWPRGR